MGDIAQDNDNGLPSASQNAHQPEEIGLAAPSADGSLSPSTAVGPSTSHQLRPAEVPAPFFSQYPSVYSSQRMESFGHAQTHGFTMSGSPSQYGSSFNMGAIAGSLPEYSSQASPSGQGQRQHQRGPSGASTAAAAVYQPQQSLQYPQQAVPIFPQHGSQGVQGIYGGQTPYPLLPAQASPGGYMHFQGQLRSGAMPQQYSGYSAMNAPLYYYSGAVSTYQGLPGHGQVYEPSMGFRSGAIHQNGRETDSRGSLLDGNNPGVLRSHPSTTTPGSIPRGPPRKPKQSGHALWVGNLPPGATILDLKDHFSREATKDIESLFLISKSNCAFVNYRSECACQAAMQRFHDSRFNGVRLVCRLRRSSMASAGIPTAPAAMSGRRSPIEPSMRPSLQETASITAVSDGASPDPVTKGDETTRGEKVAEKYFIVKSLTLQDLEQSVRNGVWATQSHNEQLLNRAFDAADNVYLIFSANKSGEYFGYARMVSPINENASELMRSLPQGDVTADSDAPKTIPTVATEWAPKGRIIDDSARGTIFWEAESLNEEETSERPSVPEPVQGDSGPSQVWGKPFKIEWLSTNRLPFYRTRGLRNPWNANREVKIARDGTELETNIGRRLVQMFHQPSTPGSAVSLLGGSQTHGGLPFVPF